MCLVNVFRGDRILNPYKYCPSVEIISLLSVKKSGRSGDQPIVQIFGGIIGENFGIIQIQPMLVMLLGCLKGIFYSHEQQTEMKKREKQECESNPLCLFFRGFGISCIGFSSLLAIFSSLLR